MSPEHIEHLLEGLMLQTLEPAEQQELTRCFIDPALREEVQAALARCGSRMPATASYDAARFDPLLQALLVADRPARMVSLYRGARRRWLGAAAVLLLLAGAGWFFLLERKQQRLPALVVRGADIPAPQAIRASIRLSDGRVIAVDSLQQGLLVEEDEVKVVKAGDGTIRYEGGKTRKTLDVAFNTLNNPRGSRVTDLRLTDGTHVWLNAGSSLTYPVVFPGNERKVTVTGEAYFEVAHDPGRPFYVSDGDTRVRVLGTHFNVNAYEDEAAVRVTLLEGAVEVIEGEGGNVSAKVRIVPGEQAVRHRDSRSLGVQKDVNVDAVMAWKNGYFHFDHASLQEILRQASRWYDLDVNYEGPVPHKEFGGEMERSLPLSSVLRLLQKSGVQYHIEGKKLTVEKSQ